MLKPAAVRRVVVLELDEDLLRHRLAVRDIEGMTDPLGKLDPDVLADQVLRATSENLRGLAIDVSIAPVAVEKDAGVRDAFEDPCGALVGLLRTTTRKFGMGELRDVDEGVQRVLLPGARHARAHADDADGGAALRSNRRAGDFAIGGHHGGAGQQGVVEVARRKRVGRRHVARTGESLDPGEQRVAERHDANGCPRGADRQPREPVERRLEPRLDDAVGAQHPDANRFGSHHPPFA